MASGSFFERLPKENDGADLGTKSRLDTSKMFKDVTKTIKRFRSPRLFHLKILTSCDLSKCSQVPEACHAKRGSLDLKLMKHQDSRNFLKNSFAFLCRKGSIWNLSLQTNNIFELDHSQCLLHLLSH